VYADVPLGYTIRAIERDRGGITPLNFPQSPTHTINTKKTLHSESLAISTFLKLIVKILYILFGSVKKLYNICRADEVIHLTARSLQGFTITNRLTTPLVPRYGYRH